MNDLDIVELYWRRTEQAIDESDKKYGRLCRSISMNLLGQSEDAEECVNDTWLAAWNKIPPCRPASLCAFLGRITRNLSVSRWRQEHARKRSDGIEVLLSELEDCVPTAATVEGALDQKLLGETVSSWLDSLKAEDRRLFIRRYWYCDSVKSLASELHEKTNTVSKRLQRLRSALRSFFESEGLDI